MYCTLILDPAYADKSYDWGVQIPVFSSTIFARVTVKSSRAILPLGDNKHHMFASCIHIAVKT